LICNPLQQIFSFSSNLGEILKNVNFTPIFFSQPGELLLRSLRAHVAASFHSLLPREKIGRRNLRKK
jgi:hypothetical protein